MDKLERLIKESSKFGMTQINIKITDRKDMLDIYVTYQKEKYCGKEKDICEKVDACENNPYLYASYSILKVSETNDKLTDGIITCIKMCCAESRSRSICGNVKDVCSDEFREKEKIYQDVIKQLESVIK